jgi:hypothetical protein
MGIASEPTLSLMREASAPHRPSAAQNAIIKNKDGPTESSSFAVFGDKLVLCLKDSGDNFLSGPRQEIQQKAIRFWYFRLCPY